MPEKDGDGAKSTKSVVNKKQKQMMGEEGYDIARDMGRVRPSKDKKDATTMPPSKEMKKTQKVNKGPSAFERVKAKYGKSVMNVGKKKVKEELDLTQVAEAFGGYVICENPTIPIGTQKAADETPEEIKKRLAKLAAQERLARKGIDDKPKRVINKMAKNIAKQEIEATGDKFVGGANLKNLNRKKKQTFVPTKTIGPMKVSRVPPETLQPGINPTGERKRGRPVGAKDKTQRYVAKNPSKKDEVLAAMTPGQRERNLRRIQKDIDDRNPTIPTQVGAVPSRNRRVPKTRSLVPQYDRTPEIMKPDTDELLKFKDFRKRTKTTTAELDKNQEFRAPRIPQTQTEVPPPKPPLPPKPPVGGESGGSRAFNSILKFSKRNPAAALATYDLGKGILSKIMKTRMPSVVGGKAGFRSAGGNTAT